MEYFSEEYDVVVVGAGHAGCEAGLASARMGCKTLVCTMNLDSIGFMPCNPNVGGTAKGHLVREIDALGGEMGVNIDNTFIQSRMLNTSKGPAVHSLRAQADKKKYSERMKHVIESQNNLFVRQLEVLKILTDEENSVCGVITKNGARFSAKAVVLATGTYLKGKVIIGDVSYSSGPNGFMPANDLSQSLIDLGIQLRRFKTGTPARVSRRSVDFSKMVRQDGDKNIVPFSFMTNYLEREQIPCYLTYTTQDTLNVIRKNIHRSPLYNGSIKSVGPRYCPSIEDKVVRFPDKEKHQIFIEPEGENTEELYVDGASTSMPEDVQIEMYKTIEGLENVEFLRTGYAIEYDCINPLQLKLSLEFKNIGGLFGAGQLNGSSGYEEAAAQGIIAGINAALKVKGREALVLKRSDAYIGVLIDDLVTKGTEEPYRMMTSRAEYRLILRQDNADLRLTEIGREIGLVSDERYDRFLERKKSIYDEIDRIKNVRINPKKSVIEFLNSVGSSELKKTESIYELIKRPELDYFKLKDLDEDRNSLDLDVQEEVNIISKYEGYIKKQMEQIAQFKKFEGGSIPENIDYDQVQGVRIEAIQKFKKVRPANIGQASRISGVSPADISVLMIYMEKEKRKK